MLGHLILPEIEEMIQARNFAGLRESLRAIQPPDLGELLAELPPEDQAIVFRLLPRSVAAATFAYLELDAQESLLKALGQDQVAAILNDMSPDDRTALLEELPGEVTKQLLALLTPQERAVARSLLGYPEDSIGRLMTPDFLAVREDWTIQRVLEHIRKHGRDSETLNVIYVVDDRGVLIDDVRLRDVLLADPETRMIALMDRSFTALKAAGDQEDAVTMFSRFDRFALPVTDDAGLLLGIVTVDDVLDVAEEEATEDMQKLGGVAALDDPYMEVSIMGMVRKRIGWLVVLFVSGGLTANAMAFFDTAIEKAAVLALFVPLVIASGGNSGSQAATLIIRSLALDEVSLGDWFRVVRRELAQGLVMGTILGAIGFVLISIWAQIAPTLGEHWPLVGLTVFIALIGVVTWGTLVGSMLPLVLRRLGADPAVSSTPFVATLVDVTGIVIYFTVATAILRGVLL